jgi:hypothetical protein
MAEGTNRHFIFGPSEAHNEDQTRVQEPVEFPPETPTSVFLRSLAIN